MPGTVCPGATVGTGGGETASGNSGLRSFCGDATENSGAVAIVASRRNGKDAQTPPAMIERPRRTRFLDTPYAPHFQPASGTDRLPGNSAALRLSTSLRGLASTKTKERGRSDWEKEKVPPDWRDLTIYMDSGPGRRPAYRAGTGDGLLITLPPPALGLLCSKSSSGAAMKTVL